MQAWVFHQVNEAPSKQDIELTSDSNLVEVSIKASAINHRDVWISKGQYPGISPGIILGSDACGEVDGKEIIINPGLDWGDNEAFQSSRFRVLGMPDHGTFAEKINIDSRYIYAKPSHLSTFEAAALPLAGVTAFRALMTKAKPNIGDKILISGIGGGVAMMAFLLARAQGYEVYVTSGSDEKIEKAVALGAKKGYSYHDADWTKKLMSDSNGGVAIVIDGACGQGFNQFVKVCKPGARIVFYGGSLGKIDGLNPQLIFWRQINILGTTMGSDSDFQGMLDLVNLYKIRPIVDEIFSFNDLPKAFDKMNNGAQFGKIVINHGK